MRTSLTTLPPLVEGYAAYFAAKQMPDGLAISEPCERMQLPELDCRKSLDDLDEDADEDDDEDDDLDEDDDEDALDDEDEDDLEDYDEDEDDDEDDDEEDEDEEDDVKPLKM